MPWLSIPPELALAPGVKPSRNKELFIKASDAPASICFCLPSSGLGVSQSCQHSPAHPLPRQPGTPETAPREAGDTERVARAAVFVLPQPSAALWKREPFLSAVMESGKKCLGPGAAEPTSSARFPGIPSPSARSLRALSSLRSPDFGALELALLFFLGFKSIPQESHNNGARLRHESVPWGRSVCRQESHQRSWPRQSSQDSCFPLLLSCGSGTGLELQQDET